MQPILIPPIADLQLYGAHQNMFLLLSHLSKFPSYIGFHRRAAERGAYLILDNSAHEYSVGQAPKSLASQAVQLKAREIVCPDHLEDGPDTVVRTTEALHYFAGESRHALEQLHPRFMMVPQGYDLYEWRECLKRLLVVYDEAAVTAPHLFDRPPVIGLSKDYEIWDGGLLRLIEEYLLPQRIERGIDIHLLGWGRQLWMLNEIAKRHGDQIRSVDSAKPFVYGLAGIRLDPSGPPPEYPKRPQSYFETPLSYETINAVDFNIAIFTDCARGKLWESSQVTTENAVAAVRPAH